MEACFKRSKRPVCLGIFVEDRYALSISLPDLVAKRAMADLEMDIEDQITGVQLSEYEGCIHRYAFPA